MRSPWAATLYYLLTKTPPTPAFLRALNHPLKPPFQINPNISDAVHKAILQGMEMDATKRPQSVQKWLDMLPQSPGNWGLKGGFLPTIPSPQLQLPIPSPQPQQQPVQLISAKGIDYRQLERLLANGEWRKANDETSIVMLKAAGREKLWLDQKSLEQFPCEDLQIIDQLWVKYSNGLFGFSVQKRIYESLGGTRKYDEKIWKAFGDQVGWYVSYRLWPVQWMEWLKYDHLEFNTEAPSGHLPAVNMYGSWLLNFSFCIWVLLLMCLNLVNSLLNVIILWMAVPCLLFYGLSVVMLFLRERLWSRGWWFLLSRRDLRIRLRLNRYV